MRFLLGFLLAAFTAAPAGAQTSSQIFIDVGQAQAKKSVLALPPIKYVGTQGTNAEHLRAGQDIFRTIFNDLTVSGYFIFQKPEAFLEDPNKTGLRPAPGMPNGFKFENWKTIGTEFLVRAAYNVVGGDMTMEAYVYHVPSARQVMGKNYRGPAAAVRRMGHTFANDLLEALTGKKGMFLTRFVASRQDARNSAVKEIYTMDWDGTGQTRITSGQTVSMSPAWSTKGDKIAYTSFAYHTKNKTRNSDLFVFDIPSGRRFMVSYRKGMNSGAAFVPGDAAILLTLSYEGSPDIYRMTADGVSIKPLTRGPNRALNVEPAISADGSKVAFSSDRSGNPHVYVMGIDGSNPRRLTSAGKYNASPAWSPDGKTIAFAGDDSGAFDIFTIGADGTGLKRLTTATKANGRRANNESPSWSPDGRHILFTSDRTGNYQLYIINADGTNERRITNDRYNWDKPKWSPYLD